MINSQVSLFYMCASHVLWALRLKSIKLSKLSNCQNCAPALVTGCVEPAELIEIAVGNDVLYFPVCNCRSRSLCSNIFILVLSLFAFSALVCFSLLFALLSLPFKDSPECTACRF